MLEAEIQVKFGVLLPHYGQHCSAARILNGTKLVEDLGFDSVWVRDHLIWSPHEVEGEDNTFLDAFVTLAYVAAATRSIELGTAVAIPIRWPLKVAQNFASLSYLAGRTVHAGFGLGSSPIELGGAGFRVEDRIGIFEETIQICEQAWRSGVVDWHGAHFEVDHVRLAPGANSNITPWYGGTTRASVRRAVTFCQGWLPGRVPLATLDDRLGVLRRLEREQNRERVLVGTIPLVYIDESRARAAERLDIEALAGSSEGSRLWVKPRSGSFQSLDDLEGLIVAGGAEECAIQLKSFERRGVDHVILDLRLQYESYEEKLELIASKVLPLVRSDNT